jgi:hypothetical protein
MMKMGNFICKGVPKSENKNIHTIKKWKNAKWNNNILVNNNNQKIDKFNKNLTNITIVKTIK